MCPLLICSSDLERNALTLLARVDAKAFDKASHVFEARMVEETRRGLDRTSWIPIYNRTLSAMKGAGEVDVLLFDRDSRTALLLELWWSIPPSEATEVLRREEKATEKAAQAHSKLASLQRNLSTVLRQAGIEDTAGWSAHALLVTDGFLPTQRTGLVPVVTRRTLLGHLAPAFRASDTYARIASEFWLPVLGEHFTTTAVDHDCNTVQFSSLAIDVTPAGLRFAASTLA
jgi:hypothetical protein